MNPIDAQPATPLNQKRGRRWFIVAGVLVVLTVCAAAAVVPPAFRQARESARREQCKNNLKQIGVALLNYHDVYHCFPPPYVADEEGRPMHSWRVLIRPFLDASPASMQYRHDEPWNGPNNSKLLSSERERMGMPCYRCLSEEHDDLLATDYLAVVGPGTVWNPEHPVSRNDIADGPSNTLLLVEVVGSGIRWPEPRDLTLDEMSPTVNARSGLGISSRHKGGAYGLMADGSVVFLSDKLPSATIRGLVSISGGENVAP